MRNKNLEKLIPITMEVFEKDKSKFSKETKGYFSSYGPSIIMAGLRQTVKSYEGSKDKKYINNIIWKIMGKMDSTWRDEKKSLDELVNSDKNRIPNKNRILEVIVACKLCIKTFDLKV
ncbi:MAG TPA: hypothetical protein EYG98_04815 [Sulfurovum sp.]|nr:hypothetical protein [Sulfurovum sp.]